MRVNSFFHVAFGNSASKGQDKAVTRCIVAIFTLLLGIIGLFVMHQQDPLGWRVMNSCLSVGRSLVLFDLWGQWSGMRIRNGFQGTKGHSLRKKPTDDWFLHRRLSRRTNIPHKVQASCWSQQLHSQIQRARHWGVSQDCVLVSGFCWYKEASQGTNHHPGQGAGSVGSSVSPWSLGVRALHSSFSLYLFCRDLRSGTHQSRGLFKGAVTECSMCVNDSYVVRILPQKWRVWAKHSPQPGGTVEHSFKQPNLLYPTQHGTAEHGLVW